jgi:hypothetical protein
MASGRFAPFGHDDPYTPLNENAVSFPRCYGVPFASGQALFNLSKLAVWWLRLGIGIERIKPGHPQQKDYASHCTSSIRCDTTRFTDRWDSLIPCAFRGGFSPGSSYRQSFLSL